MWCSIFFFIVLVAFFLSCFHLQQKHEEGQRLLRYLQQTNTASAEGTFIYVKNQGTCEHGIKCRQS